MDLAHNISNSIKSIVDRKPSIGLILGSGLGEFAETLDDRVSIPTSSIEGYPTISVEGHAGELVFGKLIGKDGMKKDILAFKGRLHFYESGDLSEAVLPIRVARELGIRRLIITNAAGGMNPLFSAGDLMLIRDFINTTFENPLLTIDTKYRQNNDFHESYLSDLLIQKALSVARELRISLRQGTYCWVKGPSYETAAEIQMLRRMGGDAVGMSTVPEIIVASHLGIECVVISCITNMATGLSMKKLSHNEVTETAKRVRKHFSELITALAIEIG